MDKFDLCLTWFLVFCLVAFTFLGITQFGRVDKIEQEIQSLKEEIKGLTSNPKLITPQPNEPIEIGKVGNGAFFLAKIDDKECISVIGLNMGSYFICGNEPPQTAQGK